MFGEATIPRPVHDRRLTKAHLLIRVLVVAASIMAFASTNPHTARAQGGIAGMTVFLDPGHNAINDASTTAQVPDGRGGAKQCVTSGTNTPSGYPEHSFNWDVVQRISAALSDRGLHIVLSRNDDTSAGPCVDQRAAAANSARPDAIVSIHGDGGPPAGEGFHVNYSAPPLNDAQAGPAMQLATIMRDQLVASGAQPSTYIGANGLYGRADLAGLNLAQYPAILVELGNMKNADDATKMQDTHGRQMYADAVVAGIVAYLNQKAP